MKSVLACLVCAALLGCVPGAPPLTVAQSERVTHIPVYRFGTPPERAVTILALIEAADCSGPGGTRLHGRESKALETLKQKAAALGGDAIIDVSCDSTPLLNNCWSAMFCDGKAVRWR